MPVRVGGSGILEEMMVKKISLEDERLNERTGEF
jgi:hypothetical protein